jgi:hypothetical protein
MRGVLLIALSTACSSRRPPMPHVVDNEPVGAHYDHALRIDHMVMPRFYAYAKDHDGPDSLGGYYASHNMPTPNERRVLGNKLAVLALVDEPHAFGSYSGFRVIVANASPSPIVFPASDSTLAMVHEAIDPSGHWAPIEELPHSWCGNSYHELTLPPGQSWELAAPHYDGDFATKLRLRIDSKAGSTYSNEWYGRVSREQFTPLADDDRRRYDNPYPPD